VGGQRLQQQLIRHILDIKIEFNLSKLYLNIVYLANEESLTMADLVRDRWYDKQNSLAVFEELDKCGIGERIMFRSNSKSSKLKMALL
jgi:hypothetical protein